jgi:hypothetical protein
MRATLAISPRRNRRDQRSYRSNLCKQRDVTKRFLNKPRQFRIAIWLR